MGLKKPSLSFEDRQNLKLLKTLIWRSRYAPPVAQLSLLAQAHEILSQLDSREASKQFSEWLESFQSPTTKPFH